MKKKKRSKKVFAEWCPAYTIPPNPGWTEFSNFERCPVCNKRLKVLFMDPYHYLPAHKAKRKK